MEFEDNRPTSDEDRRLAEAKKLTLTPIHNDVAPEGPSDTELAAQHINGPAIANISTDTEAGDAHMQPSKGLLEAQPTAVQSRKPLIGIVAGSVAFISLALLALLK